MHFSLITHSSEFPLPGKTYTLDRLGNLDKSINGAFVEAELQVMKADLDQLASFLKETAKPENVLVAGTPVGIPPNERCWLVAEDDDRAGKIIKGRLVGTRTKLFLPYPSAPGLLCIDSDGKQSVPVREQLVAAVPALAGYKAIEKSSTSSNIYDIWSGEMLRGEEGFHTFFHVADARDIPRALQVLHKRLVLLGHGYVKVSESGIPLLRSSVDLALRTPSQPIYLKPQLGSMLAQDRRVTVYPGEEVLDTRGVLPDLNEEDESRYNQISAELVLRAMPEAQRQQRVYIERRQAEAVSRGLTEAQATQSVLRALAYQELGLDEVIQLAKGKTVSVSDILAAPEQYHGVVCADPLEPDYGSGVGVAKIFSQSDRPNIHSFAHGGQVFWLVGATGCEFEAIDSLEDLEARQVADAKAALGDVELRAWLDAEVVSGPKVVALPGTAEMSADAMGLAYCCKGLGLPSDPLPSTLVIADDQKYPGIGLRVLDHEGAHKHIVLSVAAAEKLLTEWVKHDRGDATRQWQDWVAAMVAFPDGANDVHAEVILRHVTKTLKLTTKQAKDRLLASLHKQQERLIELKSRTRPRPPEGDICLEPRETPKEREVRLQAERLAESAALLNLCRHIAEQPMVTLGEALQNSGVAGELKAGEFCYLIITSAHFDKPANGVTRGPSGTGKSHVMKAVARLFPDEHVYRISSISPKALVYEPGGFSHRTILLDEAEVLVRKGDETNPTAEMLRVLLSEGQLIHKVVEKNPATGGHETRTYTVEGPTNLLTTTTRAYLDAEVENRLVDQYSDVSPDHQKAVYSMLGELAAGASGPGPDLAAWHAFAHWVRLGPSDVVVPDAIRLAERFKNDLPYRTFNNIMALAKASALVHRLHRQVDGEGRLVAELDDYRVAYDILSERINELVEAKIPDDKVVLFWEANDIIEKHGRAGAGNESSFGDGEWRPPGAEFEGRKLSGKELETTDRQFGLLANWSKSTARHRLNYLTGTGLLAKDVMGSGRHAKTRLSVGPDALILLKGGQGLPSPDELLKAMDPD